MNKSLKILSMMEFSKKEIKSMRISDELYDEFSEFRKSLRSQSVKMLNLEDVLKKVDETDWNDVKKSQYAYFEGLYGLLYFRSREQSQKVNKDYPWYYSPVKKGDSVRYPNGLGGTFSYDVKDIKDGIYTLVGNDPNWKRVSGEPKLNREQMLQAIDDYTGLPVNI